MDVGPLQFCVMGSQTDGADFPLSQPMRRITADMFDDDEIDRCLAFEEEEELRRAEEIEAQWNQEVAWTEMVGPQFFHQMCSPKHNFFFFLCV